MSDPAPPPKPPAPAGRRALVVGASSGVGEAVVRRLAADGWQVAALARRADALSALAASAEGASAVVHDVHAVGEVPELFERLVRRLGGLDLLVYAAGIMPPVGRGEYDTAKDLDILAVNFGGLVAWGNAAAALFASQRRGALVGVSSISGDRGRRGNPLYGASKAAMDNYLESLRNRLSPFGVSVTTIKPGYVATRMTEGLQGLFWVASPAQVADAIVGAAAGAGGVRYVLRRWWFVAQVVKAIPSCVFRRLDF